LEKKLVDESSLCLQIKRKRRRHRKIYYEIDMGVYSLVTIPTLSIQVEMFANTWSSKTTVTPSHPLNVGKRFYTHKTILCVRVLFLSSEKQSPIAIKHIQVYYFYFIYYTCML